MSIYAELITNHALNIIKNREKVFLTAFKHITGEDFVRGQPDHVLELVKMGHIERFIINGVFAAEIHPPKYSHNEENITSSFSYRIINNIKVEFS